MNEKTRNSATTTLAACALGLAALCAATPASAWYNDGRPEMDNFAMESQIQGYLHGGAEPSLPHESTMGPDGEVALHRHSSAYARSSQLFGGPSHMRGADHGSDRDLNPNGGFWSMMGRLSARARRTSDHAVAFARKHPAQARRNDAAQLGRDHSEGIYGIDRGRFGTPSGAPDSDATDTGAVVQPFHHEAIPTPKNFRPTALRGAAAPKAKAPVPAGRISI